MFISQHDIARMSDDALRRFILSLWEGCDAEERAARGFTARLAAAMHKALKERQRLMAVAELELLNDDEAEGCLVEPGFDPLEEWRRGMSEGPL